MNTKPPPGPWHWFHPARHATGIDIVDDNGDVVARVSTRGEPADDAGVVATTDLIAAAGTAASEIEGMGYDGTAAIRALPELTQACEIQQRLLNDMARFVGKMALADYALFNEAPLKARAALAKARGGRAAT